MYYRKPVVVKRILLVYLKMIILVQSLAATATAMAETTARSRSSDDTLTDFWQNLKVVLTHSHKHLTVDGPSKMAKADILARLRIWPIFIRTHWTLQEHFQIICFLYYHLRINNINKAFLEDLIGWRLVPFVYHDTQDIWTVQDHFEIREWNSEFAFIIT